MTKRSPRVRTKPGPKGSGQVYESIETTSDRFEPVPGGILWELRKVLPIPPGYCIRHTRVRDPVFGVHCDFVELLQPSDATWERWELHLTLEQNRREHDHAYRLDLVRGNFASWPTSPERTAAAKLLRDADEARTRGDLKRVADTLNDVFDLASQLRRRLRLVARSASYAKRGKESGETRKKALAQQHARIIADFKSWSKRNDPREWARIRSEELGKTPSQLRRIISKTRTS